MMQVISIAAAVVLFGVALWIAISAVRSGAHGGWLTVRWAVSTTAFCAALLSALMLL